MEGINWGFDEKEGNLTGGVDIHVNISASSITSNGNYSYGYSDYGSVSKYPSALADLAAAGDIAGNGGGGVGISENIRDCFGCIESSSVGTFTAEGFTTLSSSTDIPLMGTYDNSSDDGLYDVPMSIIILLSLLYGGISIAALIGNMLVLWVVSVSRRMRTVTNMFIANLALADIIIGLFAIPFQFQAALLQRWNLPEFMCSFCPFVQVLSVNVSVFTLSAIAVDRYRAVLYPLSARVSKRKAAWAILSIWSASLLLALPTELDYKVIYIMEKGTTKPFCANLSLSSTFRMYYTLGLVVIQYFFPLIIITGAYAHMATKLWGTTAPGNKEESRDAVVLRNKKKVIKMLALVVLLFALCWLPLQMYNFLQTLIPSINGYQYINIIWFCSHWLAMSNSCCNPFIYAIYNDKFQREFRARLGCVRLWRKTGADNNRGEMGAHNYSECSDFIDRSKIRASYRFTNNRAGGALTVATRSSIYNDTSFYGVGGTSSRTNMTDSHRNSSISYATEQQRISPPSRPSSSGSSTRYNQCFGGSPQDQGRVTRVVVQGNGKRMLEGGCNK